MRYITRSRPEYRRALSAGAFVLLPQVEEDALAKSLTYRSFLTKSETVTKPLSTAQATDCRDAFVKVSNAPRLAPLEDH